MHVKLQKDFSIRPHELVYKTHLQSEIHYMKVQEFIEETIWAHAKRITILFDKLCGL